MTNNNNNNKKNNNKQKNGSNLGEELHATKWKEWINMDIPLIEWWDHPFLNNPDDGYTPEAKDCGLKISSMPNIIHHPVPLAPIAEKPLPPPMPLMLTKKERKKIRRMRKMEKQKEIQEKTGFGMLEAAEPKLKISNMMRVLGEEAVALPSAIEAQVRKAMKVRQAEHEANNEASRLTPEQKRARRRQKLKENTSTEVQICLFR